ncbi:MAG TPA: SusE domain-containing protein [Flavisolibacter sp.]|jgi:hypothetical protein|nr:SusE domain-containing protein [Flavisolibacter sp.]
MKNIIKYLLGAFAFTAVMVACEKDEKRITLEGGDAPVLTASRTGTIPLSFANKDQEALKLSWTNPNYKFTTGVSSQNVTYTVEIDTTGANFTNPNKKVITVGSDLSLSMSQNDFNDYLLNQLQLKPGTPHNLDVRVTSSLTSNSAALPSNVLKFVVTPYAIPPKVDPPASGNLYITGAATAGNWMSDNPPSPIIPAQTFTKLSPTLFEIASINLIGGQEYLLVPVFGNWGAKYGAVEATSAFNPDGGDFKLGGNNFKSPAASGNYKIQVDFQRGKITVTKL